MVRRALIFLGRLPRSERAFVLDALRAETVGGALLLLAAVVALVWANSPISDSYDQFRDLAFGPEALHLHLSVKEWAADGLLAVFFLVAGLELKREVVVGELHRPETAVLPVVAAVCGMILPALTYLAVAASEPGAAKGWAIPTATDIAFALAVLAVTGSALPAALRAFLLTMAVVDDLGAILIIAVFFSDRLRWGPLLATVGLLTGYAALQRARVRSWWVYVPLGLTVWGFTHASGVHATVAGVAIGLLTRVRHDPGEEESPTERAEHRLRPFSAAVAVPLFALTSAGMAVSGDALGEVLADRAALGIVAGLVVGKVLGVFGGSYLVARLTRAQLNEDLDWPDVLAVSMLGGIGFTVSLLIGDLAFAGEARAEHVKAAVLIGSLLAAALASTLLRVRHRHYRLATEHEIAEASR